MPAAVRYSPPGTKERDSITNVFTGERLTREKKIKLAREYYAGNHPPQLAKIEGEPDDNVVLNLFRQALDRTLSFLFPAMPTFRLDELSPAITPDEKWLRDAWEANGGLARLVKIAQEGCLSGHCFVRILPAKGPGQFPRIVNLPSETVTAFWKPDDIETVLWFELFWQGPNGARIIDFVNWSELDNAEGRTGWAILEYEQPPNGIWTLALDSAWPLRCPPIIGWQHLPTTGSYYGIGEAENLSLNQKVNLVLSEGARINRYYASPRTVVTGVPEDEVVATEIDGLWTIENENASVLNLEMRGDGNYSRWLADTFTESFLAERSVVLIHGDVKDFQRVTNAGVRTVFMDMIRKNAILRATYGQALQLINYGLLELVRKTPVLPFVVWPDPLPVDETEVMNMQKVELDAKLVSRETIAVERGRDWETEKKRIKGESEDPALNPFAAMREAGAIGGEGGGFGNNQNSQAKKGNSDQKG